MNNNSKNIVSKAEWLRKYKLKKRLMIIIAILIAIILIGTFIITKVYAGFGSFTISVDQKKMRDYGITLSTDLKNAPLISKLNAEPLQHADATRADDIDELQNIGAIGGSQNGKNYMMYTFYLINSGNKFAFTYEYVMRVNRVEKNLDEAIRIKLFIDDVEQGIWGKQEPDGSVPLRDYELNQKFDENGKIVYDRSESNQINIYAGKQILSGKIENLQPKSATKFTVIMWIEGTDPECNNDLLGGNMRVDMKMTILDEQSSDEQE